MIAPDSLTDSLPETLRALASIVAEETAEFLRAARLQGVSIAATKSTALDIVTRADQEAEALIRARLLGARPEDGFLGEEGTGTIAGTSGIMWIVDPLDGTVNYLYGSGPYAVSIAAVRQRDGAEVTIAAAVHVCTTEETFSAAIGAGALLNEVPLPQLTEGELESSLVGTDFGYDPVARAEQSLEAARVAPRVRGLRIGGSAATDLCLVAAGRLDAYFERGLAPWDYAAGALIVAEAGGAATGPTPSQAPSPELVLAAAPALAESLRGLLTPARP